MPVKVQCDDQATDYIDGAEVARTGHWKEIWNGQITDDRNHLLAVECYNYLDRGFIMASVGDPTAATDDSWAVLPVVSDMAWRCSSTFVSDWYGVAFDDSSWNSAYEIGPTGFETNAKHIWANEHLNTIGFSYCRIQIGESGR